VKLSEVGRLYPELAGYLGLFGFEELYPPQAEAIRMGALEEGNFLLASGTASGKTVVATLSALRTVAGGKKAVYLAPLRALAFEKFREFRKFPVDVRLSIGDYDSEDRELGEAQVIVCTYEKLDALLRHRPDWVKDIGLVVFDEVHEMGNKAVIESLIIKLSGGKRRMMTLSATVGNSQEMADWMEAQLLVSNFRPVPLKEGVFTENSIHWEDGVLNLKGKSEGLMGLVEDGLERGFQTQIFANTRREAETQAEASGKIVKNFLTKNESEKLKEISEKIRGSLPHPTRQCERLATIIQNGAAFHHAGLVNSQRIAVEDAFKAGLVKTLVSTVTLVAGINLPSRRVVIRNLKWFASASGMWPVSLYKQAAGRAGRPGFDDRGEAIVCGCYRSGKEMVFTNYIKGEVEAVQSQLAYEPTMRKEILGLFASGFAFRDDDLRTFMERSFYAHQFGNADRVKQMGAKVLTQLIAWGMLEAGESGVVRVTPLGRRVAELYIDPYTAMEWMDKYQPTSDFGYLHLACLSRDIRLPMVRKAEEEELSALLASRKEELTEPPAPWDFDFELYIQALKATRVMQAWIDEESEDRILDNFGIAPGDLRNYLNNVEWLVYSLEQVVEATRGPSRDLKKLVQRIKYGVRSDLLELVQLPGIGRVRARKMHKAGVTRHNLTKVLEEKPGMIAELVGQKVMEKLLANSGGLKESKKA